jgi:trehalose-phosphatase
MTDTKAFIFDLDGVITDTQELHSKAWKRMFNEFLEDQELGPFQSDDYVNYLDGKPRQDGIRSFLKSRHLNLPEEKVAELGSKKNTYYHQLLQEEGAKIIHDTVDFIRELHAAHIPMALVSSSRNAHKILKLTGLEEYFASIVTPIEAEPKGLKGKPHPDYFLEAARELHLPANQCAVVEDSLAGVEAAKAGGFQEVVGLDYRGNEAALSELKKHGADESVASLWELEDIRDILPLPNLLDKFDHILPPDDKLEYYLFLDFDGTLSPLVDVPSEAQVLKGLADIIQRCAENLRVCIITGRDTPIIREKLPLSNVVYIACHGFEITSFPNFSYQVEEAKASLPLLEEAHTKFSEIFKDIKGLVLERKTFGLALHYRMIDSPQEVDKMRQQVSEYVAQVQGLKIHEGEEVIELLPQVHWDKGMAMLKLYEVFGIQQKDLPPLYLGDGQTDEHAFREMENWGIPVLTSVEQRPTKARYHLQGPEEVKKFLEKLLQRLESRSHYV